MSLREELPYNTSIKTFINKPNALSIPKWCTNAMCFLWIAALAALFSDLHIRPFVIPLFQLHDLPIQLSFGIDRLTLLMMTIITMISLFVHQYALRYLKFDTEQNRFMLHLSMVSVSVLFFVCSANLLTAFIGWQLIGFSLYLLLNHYHFEAEANRSAKKKFVLNRIGDLCFITAVIIAYKAFGTSELNILTEQSVSSSSVMILSLLVVAVMTKSAQFPFHIWLPDTMQTPTPVSALMHAGVINSGGILLSRLSPWLIHHLTLMQVIFWIGFITMLVGAIVMRKQPDVKKKLAYSTMSQMGYMVMQCGIGGFTLALYHLIVHGFFKSSQFLNAGTVDHSKANSYRNTNKLNELIFQLAVIAITAIGAFFILGKLENPIYLIFMVALVAVSVKSIYKYSKYPQDLALSLAIIATLVASYILLAHLTEYYLSGVVTNVIYVNTYQFLACAITGLVFIALSEKPTSTIYQLKISVEKIYRQYLLKPFRKIGEGINQYQLTIALAITVSLAVTIFLQQAALRDCLIWVTAFTAIIGSNKSANPSRFMVYVILSQLSILALYVLNADSTQTNFMIYYLTTTAAIILPLALIIRTSPSKKPSDRELSSRNKLTQPGFYFAVCAMLLIGAPGSAMLINELGILTNFYQFGLSYVVLYCGYLLILTISVLHALQYYVFNKSYYFTPQSAFKTTHHIIFITAILFNIVNGIYPMIQLGA